MLFRVNSLVLASKRSSTRFFIASFLLFNTGFMGCREKKDNLGLDLLADGQQPLLIDSADKVLSKQLPQEHTPQLGCYKKNIASVRGPLEGDKKPLLIGSGDKVLSKKLPQEDIPQRYMGVSQNNDACADIDELEWCDIELNLQGDCAKGDDIFPVLNWYEQDLFDASSGADGSDHFFIGSFLSGFMGCREKKDNLGLGLLADGQQPLLIGDKVFSKKLPQEDIPQCYMGVSQNNDTCADIDELEWCDIELNLQGDCAKRDDISPALNSYEEDLSDVSSGADGSDVNDSGFGSDLEIENCSGSGGFKPESKFPKPEGGVVSTTEL